MKKPIPPQFAKRGGAAKPKSKQPPARSAPMGGAQERLMSAVQGIGPK